MATIVDHQVNWDHESICLSCIPSVGIINEDTVSATWIGPLPKFAIDDATRSDPGKVWMDVI